MWSCVYCNVEDFVHSYFKRAMDRCVTPLVRLLGVSAASKNPSQGVDKINTSSVHICDTLSHIHTCNAVKTMNVSFDIISCINTVNILCDIISVNTTLKGALQTNTKTRICGWAERRLFFSLDRLEHHASKLYFFFLCELQKLSPKNS